jgi:glycerol-3-phosphate cytidylyltransferase
MKKGFTAGAFDILHAGHCLMLEEAKKHCDYLIVGLQNDPSTTSEEYRGKRKDKPVQRLDERYIQLMANRYVDQVVIYDTEEDLYKLLKDLMPDIRIIGMDWKGKNYTGHDLPIEVYFNSRSHTYSATELRKRICEAGRTNE